MQTIMIVEDDPDIRDGVCILLSGEGYRILDNITSNLLKYADPAQPVSIAALPENRTLHICICNTIRAESGQVESNKIGLRTAEKILTQMGGSFRRHEADGKFTAEAILPIVPEDADE